MHLRLSVQSNERRKTVAPYGVLMHCRVLQMSFAKGARIEPQDARREKPLFYRTFHTGDPRRATREGGPVSAPSSMPGQLRSGIGVRPRKLCAPLLAGRAVTLRAAAISAPGI